VEKNQLCLQNVYATPCYSVQTIATVVLVQCAAISVLGINPNVWQFQTVQQTTDPRIIKLFHSPNNPHHTRETPQLVPRLILPNQTKKHVITPHNKQATTPNSYLLCVIADSPQSQIQNQKIFYTGTNTKDSEFQTICDWLQLTASAACKPWWPENFRPTQFCIDSRSPALNSEPAVPSIALAKDLNS
jgi:hypothetical protein